MHSSQPIQFIIHMWINRWMGMTVVYMPLLLPQDCAMVKMSCPFTMTGKRWGSIWLNAWKLKRCFHFPAHIKKKVTGLWMKRLYCHCRGQESALMIQCDGCSEWYIIWNVSDPFHKEQWKSNDKHGSAEIARNSAGTMRLKWTYCCIHCHNPNFFLSTLVRTVTSDIFWQSRIIFGSKDLS